MSPQTAPDDSSPPHHADPDRLVDELVGEFRETAEQVIPWFLEQMPRMYFQDTDLPTQLRHLQAIIAARTSTNADSPLDITLKKEDGSEWTALRSNDGPGVLAKIVAALPLSRSLQSAKIHTSFDGNLVLDTFEFGEGTPLDINDDSQAASLENLLEYAAVKRPDWSPNDIRSYMTNCSQNYFDTLTPLRICRHHDLYEQVRGTDGTVIDLEQEADPTESRITIVFNNARTRTSLERCANLLAKHKVDIKRAYLDLVGCDPYGSVTFVGFVVQSPEGGQIDPESEYWKQIKTDLTRVKWVDFEVLDMTERNPGLRIGPGEVILALSNLAHQVLSPKNRFEFTSDRILRCVEANLDLSTRVAQLFRDRFDPRKPMADAMFTSSCEELEQDIERTATTETARAVLRKMLSAIRHVLRTNYFVRGRFGLAMRLDPNFLTNADRIEVPYGVFFVHGRGFNGFHVRFQDIARGGLRVVRPRSEAQHAQENERLYDEVYGLAYAQQLKNKDIPEGGAKAAILLEAGEGIDRCLKAFVNSLLDLITPVPETRDRIVDLMEDEELIYLGPDENVTTKHIEWIVRRARLRGYPLPTAFMSSKPGAGINHKVYGVTSEGVNVFLDIALQSVGINPRKQPFTVKITGGPDGDVAGNMIRILDRDYGDNARVVGIADGSGCAEDPDGFDVQELMRLFKEELPISEYDREKLGPNGSVSTVDQPDGAQLRNTMHNRVIADAFVPAGGRPATIHRGNWKQFLTEDGELSSPVIVEGANLFITPEARERLCEQGAVIIKDSSANKCGVICSSFEIGACMILEEEEFIEIKEEFVQQVLDRLRSLARLEATLLITEHTRHPETSLSQQSTALSRIINQAAPVIAESIPNWSDADQILARQLVSDHLPPILMEVGGDRVWSKLPERYIHWLMANRLASVITYREGLRFLDNMEPEAIVDLALKYLRTDNELKGLIQRVTESGLPDGELVAKLLAKGGVRASLDDF